MTIEHFADPEFWRTLAKQLLAAAVAASVGFLYARGRDMRRMRRFRKVFGLGIENADDIVVSVPLWSAIADVRSTPRFRKVAYGWPEETLYGPDEMYNRQDMFAAAHVLNVLNSHLRREVKYTNDTEKPEWDQKTFVLIGSPASNYHARYYLSEHAQKRPTEVLPCFREIVETEDSRARNYIYDPKSGKEYRSDKQSDYGLVLRLPNVFSKDSNHFVFLVAGIHEWSTREAGRLFNARWSTLGKEGPWRLLLRLLLPRKWHEPLPPAYFVFQMTPGERGVGTGRDVEPE